MKFIFILFFSLCSFIYSDPKVQLGVDLFFQEGRTRQLAGKRVGVITNHTGVNSRLSSTVDLLRLHAKDCELAALFAPEHGLNGVAYAAEKVEDAIDKHGVSVFSLHGKTRRPTEDMLKGIDILIYDIQDIGCRSYTYATTLYYVMEEAAKRNIKVIVLDRPNPINGLIVDGPMLAEKWRSFIGYINVPYCHGMTIGELALFFNGEYKVGCDLKIIPMRGWKREMSFKDTGLSWIPTSPYIPEADTPLFCASTGILGELNLVNIGGGYNLPFKVVGAPWIQADLFAEKLNAQKLSGVHFTPFYYRPFYGAYKGLECQGVLLVITNKSNYQPLSVQYLLLGMLKSLYPQQLMTHLSQLDEVRLQLFCKANGTDEILNILKTEKYPAWRLIHYDQEERKKFINIRAKYLIY